MKRILGVKANASAKSHAELDESETLDAGDPADLGGATGQLTRSFPTMRILGGCCGTDHRHVAAICEACVAPFASAPEHSESWTASKAPRALRRSGLRYRSIICAMRCVVAGLRRRTQWHEHSPDSRARSC